MKIETILSKESKLFLLFDDCEKAQKLSNSEKHWYWCKKLKPRMKKLVGFFCNNKELEASDVYDKVYFHCMKLMEL
jgi:hypothetical protein